MFVLRSVQEVAYNNNDDDDDNFIRTSTNLVKGRSIAGLGCGKD